MTKVEKEISVNICVINFLKSLKLTMKSNGKIIYGKKKNTPS
jgi:hypothetical protein